MNRKYGRRIRKAFWALFMLKEEKLIYMNIINTYTILFLAQIKKKMQCIHNVEFRGR